MIRPPLGVEVLAHAVRVDLQALQRLAQGPGRAAGMGERAAQRLPLRVPAARSALVLLRQGGEQHRGLAAHAARAGDRHRGAHRVALLGQGRGAAPPGGLGHLAHLGLGQELQVQRDLLQRAGGQREGGGQLAHPAAVGVPGQLGLGQAEPGGERPLTTRGPSAPREASVPTPPPSCTASGTSPIVGGRRARRAASPRPSGRRWWAAPAGAACARPSGCRGAPRPARRRPRRPRQLGRRPTPAPAGPRASRRCRARPGWWRPT